MNSADMQQSRKSTASSISRSARNSQMLNRDTWADENVRSIMGFRFVFWQQEFESSAGTQYFSAYRRMLTSC
jgi:hypothetical protein